LASSDAANDLANCVGLAFVFLSRSYGAGSSILGLTSVGIHKPLCPANVSNTGVIRPSDVIGTAGEECRWHDNRHMLVTELAETGAGDEVIMSIAGHVSRAMLSRYSHVRMEATRRALDEIATRQRAADEIRREETERQQEAAVAQAALVH
jgi:hypothetical protein